MSWKTLNTTPLVDNAHLTIRHDEFETEAGEKGNYWYHDNNGAVVIFAQKSNGNFVMIRQYRYLFDRISIESAAGGIEKGELPEVAARREFEEETGYKAGSVKLIGELASAPAFSKEWLWVYLAQDISEGLIHPDAFEDIQVIEMSEQDIDQAIASGDIWDGTTIAPWLMVKKYLNSLFY